MLRYLGLCSVNAALRPPRLTGYKARSDLIAWFFGLAYVPAMKSREPSIGLLDRILNSVSECFTAETAKALIELRQDKHVRDRMEELGVKASAGRLTPEESRQ